MKICDVDFYIHRAGYTFIFVFLFISCLALLLVPALAFIPFLATAWCIYFFRVPSRVTPIRSGLVVSPADGKVIAVQEVVPETSLGLGDTPRTRISIFLNVFDVHAQRIPADGIIVDRRYRTGKFLNASLDKASDDNERLAITVQLSGAHQMVGKKMGVVQIAGLIARRIVCDINVDDELKAGEIYGLIRFGSRVDIYLPPEAIPLVCAGQYMIGGETVIADFNSEESARVGKARNEDKSIKKSSSDDEDEESDEKETKKEANKS
ncbi:MAG: phosphatidylserine decarboxylase [Alphaproteobacteria bacterium]|nr:phosphatidylserine decarboxylase [Alphaproteobacteria bacterium]MCL2506011.1 phosphatidylserine decarboxylase [Alphaproteobacteria bacterium]